MRKSVWVVLTIVTLLLSACGPAMQPATGPQTAGGEVFMVALPRIELAFDAVGSPSILGVDLAQVGAIFGVDATAFASAYRLPKFYVDWMTAANVQHMELRQTGNGIGMWVNGKALPHIGWSDASLQKTSDLMGLFNVQNTAMIGKFLPIVRRLGLDLVLHFPKQAGAADIPLVDPTVAVQQAAAPSGEPASAVVQFEVKYDENGVPGILGISAADLAAMGIQAPLALAPAYLDLLKRNNIQNMELRGKNDGLFLYVNGEPLPNIVWDDKYLANAADIYAQMNPQSPYVTMAKQILPLVSRADIAVMVHFPVAEGQKPIAAKMHLQ